MSDLVGNLEDQFSHNEAHMIGMVDSTGAVHALMFSLTCSDSCIVCKSSVSRQCIYNYVSVYLE